MAEYNNGRYYWIKLTDRFLESDTVDYLMSQKDGSNYVVLYQMLCLKTVNQNGILARKLGEIIIPYDEEKIVRDCKYFSIDTVRIALTLYKNLGLIYEQDNGILKIADFERLIGSQTISAEKKQIQLETRRKKSAILEGGQEGGKKVEKIPPDIDIDKEIDIEIDIEKESKVSKKVSNIKKNHHSKDLQSYDEIFEGFETAPIVKEAVIEFIRHLKASFGIVMLNDRLEGLLVKLDLTYGMDEASKSAEVRRAVTNGYKRLECEGEG